MTRAELEALLARITYKPGTRCDIGPAYDYVLIRITHSVLDACNAADPTPIPVANHLRLDSLEHLTERHVLQFIESAYRSFEQHEVDEWLKLDGKHINDPHPELKMGRVA